MAHASPVVPSFETCIEAFKIWAAFFVVTIIGQLILPQSWIAEAIVILAGALAIGMILRCWLSRTHTQQLVVAVGLSIVAIPIALDMVVALTVLLERYSLYA